MSEEPAWYRLGALPQLGPGLAYWSAWIGEHASERRHPTRLGMRPSKCMTDMKILTHVLKQRRQQFPKYHGAPAWPLLPRQPGCQNNACLPTRL
eukprot:4172578-Amphidinium_carterae.1